MPSTKHDILIRLSAVRRSLRCRRSLRAVCLGLGVGGALLALLGVLDAWWPLRESISAALVGIVAIAALGVLSLRLFRALFLQPSLGELARGVERAHPSLMNALVCAVEQLSIEGERRGMFGNAVIAQAEQHTAELDLATPLLPSVLRRGRLALTAVVCVLLFAGGLNSRPARKAWASVAGDPPVSVVPGDADVPAHSDLVVHAQVRRWEPTAEIEFEDRGGRHRFAMNERGRGHTFTFYDMTEPVRYRVLSPSAASPWYSLQVYTPPDYECIRIRFTPPEYTGLSEHSVDSWRDATAVAGSHVRISLALPDDISAEWRAADQGTPLQASPDGGAATHSFRLENSLTARLVLRDGSGHMRETSPARFEVIPDQPPTVDVLQPLEDTFVPPGEAVSLVALAADDYGLSEVTLNLSVSGRRRPPQRLLDANGPSQPPLTEKTVKGMLNTEELQLRAGDVVSGHFTARDNRTPQGQQTRSRIFFIEVRPDSEREPRQQQEGQGQKQQIDIARLIAEAKRLIRFSYDLGADWRSPGADELEDLSRGLADLRNEVLRVSDQVMQFARQQGMSGEIPHLTEAASALEAAEQSVKNRFVNESIPPQELALTWLVRLAQELRKNQAAAAGSGQPQQSQPAEDGQQQEQQQRPSQSLGDRLEQLRNLLSEVTELAQRQAALNQEIEAAKSLELAGEERRELAARQSEVRKSTAALQEAARQAELRAPAASLESAAGAMRSGAQNIQDGAMADGARDGVRGHAGLLAAEENLRESMRRVAGTAVNALASQARDLARTEQDAAERSRQFAESEPPREEVDDARQQQGEVRNRAERLLTAVEQTAAGLQETFPRAAETLGRAAAQARSERMTQAMKRAENALLYKRFETARAGQQRAATQLDRLGDSLEEGAGQLPTLGRRELLEALQQIRAAQNGMQQAARDARAGREGVEQQVQQTQLRMGQLLQRLGRELGEPGLGNLGMLMKEGGGRLRRGTGGLRLRSARTGGKDGGAARHPGRRPPSLPNLAPGRRGPREVS